MNESTEILFSSIEVNNGIIQHCSEPFLEFFGYTSVELNNTPLSDKLSLTEDSSALTLEDILTRAIENKGAVFDLATFLNCSYYAVKVKFSCIHQGNNVFKFYFQIIGNNSIDLVSGLPNGWALTSRMNHLQKENILSLKDMVLITVDADNYSAINFRFNYAVGDEYLVVLGKRLQEITKGIGIVFRFSNAKFGILVEDYDALPVDRLKERIKSLCERLCLSLSVPLSVTDEIQIQKSFSIGVSTPGFEYECSHSMQIAAEGQKLKAKKFSVNKYYIANAEEKENFVTRQLIIETLPYAIAQDKIELYYQPQYDIHNNKLIGLEALSRWYDPVLGNIPPDLFVGIAEEVSLHFEFDLWVFGKVCQQVVKWQSEGVVIPQIAINVSFKTIELCHFVERLEDILAETGCPTELLELEVTETSSINNHYTLTKNMLKVKKLGIDIAIDDFGAGYSSLSLIRNFYLSLDKMKLDRSLIDKVCQSELDKAFTKHVIELGKLLGLAVLAEGVETKEQLALLTELGCDYAQGYYFAKPLCVSDIDKLLANQTA